MLEAGWRPCEDVYCLDKQILTILAIFHDGGYAERNSGGAWLSPSAGKREFLAHEFACFSLAAEPPERQCSTGAPRKESRILDPQRRCEQTNSLELGERIVRSP